MQSSLPSQSRLREVLDYDPATGVLRFRARDGDVSFNTRFAGKIAFATIGSHGYLRGYIDNRCYLAHRVIWKLVHGVDPEIVDHINGNSQDNRLSNLRSIKKSDNNRNTGRAKNNTSGTTGVYSSSGRWMASIKVNRKNIRLGSFSKLEDAVAARKAA